MQLLSCAAPPKQNPLEAVRETMLALPGAVVSADGLQVSYPGNSLFAEGAAIPLPGGMEVLDPLVDFLRANPQFSIVGTIRSGGNREEYDQLLAGRRFDILTAIFSNRGIDAERLQLDLATGEGAPFEFELQLPSSSSSAGEK